MPLPPPRVPRLLMRVWDAPTRLFHWTVVLLVIVSYTSVRLDRMDLHMLSGYAMAALLLFRLAWGFIGSDTSRFSRFLKSPVAGLQHLAHFARREPDTEIGHNAAGGWMVLAMLACLGVQVGTGLFSNDDVLTKGPLAYHVSKATSDWLSHIHSINFYVLLALDRAARPRHPGLRGREAAGPRAPDADGQEAPASRDPAAALSSPALAAVVLAFAAALVWALVRFA